MVNSDSSPLGCTGKAVLCSHEILSPLQATAVQKINEDFKSTKKYKSKINLVVKFTSGGTDFEMAWSRGHSTDTRRPVVMSSLLLTQTLIRLERLWSCHQRWKQ